MLSGSFGNLENLNVDGRIILKWLLTMQDETHEAHNRDRWRGLVNTVINLRVP
jgi:hypothetical protein